MEKLIYVLGEPASKMKGVPFEITPIGNYPKSEVTTSVTEVLKAEQSGVDLIIWNNPKLDIIKEIKPAQPAYGWQLATVNAPLVMNISTFKNVEELKEIDYVGFYSDDLTQLVRFREKMESLSGE